MRNKAILKTGILFLFIVAIIVSAFAVSIKTKAAYAEGDIFLGIDKKLDEVLEAQKQIQTDIKQMKSDIETIKNNIANKQ